MSSNRRVETRAAILDAAQAMFEARGYFATAMEAVAKQAGLSRQAIYLHFESKDALLRAVHQRINEQHVAAAFSRVWRARSATAALDAWVVAAAEAIPKFLHLANALAAGRHVDPAVDATWEEPMRGQYAQCVRLAEWLQSDGALRPGVTTNYAADMLWHYTHIHAYESLVVERGWTPARWVRWLKSKLHQELIATNPVATS